MSEMSVELQRQNACIQIQDPPLPKLVTLVKEQISLCFSLFIWKMEILAPILWDFHDR